MANMTLESLRGFLDDMVKEYGEDTQLLMNLDPLDEASNDYTDLFQFNVKAVEDAENNIYLAISLTALTLTVSEEETKKATPPVKKTVKRKKTTKKES